MKIIITFITLLSYAGDKNELTKIVEYTLSHIVNNSLNGHNSKEHYKMAKKFTLDFKKYCEEKVKNYPYCDLTHIPLSKENFDQRVKNTEKLQSNVKRISSNLTYIFIDFVLGKPESIMVLPISLIQEINNKSLKISFIEKEKKVLSMGESFLVTDLTKTRKDFRSVVAKVSQFPSFKSGIESILNKLTN